MPWMPLLIVCVLQFVIAAVIIFFLLRVLERDLIDGALEKLQNAAIPPDVAAVTVTSAAVLDPQVQSRVTSVVRRRNSGVRVVFEQDRALKGGMVVSFAEQKIDYSLAGRLNLFWSK